MIQNCHRYYCCSSSCCLFVAVVVGSTPLVYVLVYVYWCLGVAITNCPARLQTWTESISNSIPESVNSNLLIPPIKTSLYLWKLNQAEFLRWDATQLPCARVTDSTRLSLSTRPLDLKDLQPISKLSLHPQRFHHFSGPQSSGTFVSKYRRLLSGCRMSATDIRSDRFTVRLPVRYGVLSAVYILLLSFFLPFAFLFLLFSSI